MHMHEALKKPDRAQFIKAMLKEVSDQKGNGKFSIISKSEGQKDAKALPAVWQMKIKRDIKSRKVKKWKARLNIEEVSYQKVNGNFLIISKSGVKKMQKSCQHYGR